MAIIGNIPYFQTNPLNHPLSTITILPVMVYWCFEVRIMRLYAAKVHPRLTQIHHFPVLISTVGEFPVYMDVGQNGRPRGPQMLV